MNDERTMTLEEVIGQSLDPWSSKIDLSASKIYPHRLPPGVYTPINVIDLANAYTQRDMNSDYESEAELYVKNPKKCEYESSLKIISSFENAREKIKSKTHLPDSEHELKEKMEFALLYMNAFESKAITLSRKLMFVENDFTAKQKVEKDRYKRKLQKIESDKDSSIERAISEEGLGLKIITRLSEASVPFITYLATNELIDNDVARVLISVASVLPSVGIGEYFLGRLNDKRITKVVEDFENSFKDADKIHAMNIQEIEKTKKDELRRKYLRTIGELVFELERYFPEAVELVEKDSSTKDDGMSEFLEGIVEVVFPDN